MKRAIDDQASSSSNKQKRIMNNSFSIIATKKPSEELFSNDVCLEILGYLSNESFFLVRSCAWISKQWLEMVRKNSKLDLIFNGENYRPEKIDEEKSASLVKSRFLDNIHKVSIVVPDLGICTTIVNALERMPNLQQAVLHWNNSMPLVLMETISRLKQLYKLSVIGGLKFLESIGGMTNLTELDLTNNGIHNDDEVKHIVKLKNLVKLNLSQNLIPKKAAEMVAVHLVNLTDLDLSRNNLFQIMNLPNLKKLTKLNVSNTQVSSCEIIAISELPQLTYLDVSHNEELGEDEVEIISEMKKLTTLICRNELVGIHNIITMDNLTHLDVSESSIDDSGIKFISQMQHLTYLDVSTNDITDEGVKIICENMPNLTSLIIYDNQFESTGCEMLKSSRKWKILHTC